MTELEITVINTEKDAAGPVRVLGRGDGEVKHRGPGSEGGQGDDEQREGCARWSGVRWGLTLLVLLILSLGFSTTNIDKRMWTRNSRNTTETTEHIKSSILSTEPRRKNLIVFNALGKRSNLPLVEHARRHIFPPDDWDCLAFMFALEEQIPDADPHLRALADELGCEVPRTPGILWGNFLQFVTPLLVARYKYVALALDDVFLPHRGPDAVDAARMLRTMEANGLDVLSPGVVYAAWNAAKTPGHRCLVEVPAIETFVQVFTRAAWGCYYGMLHHSGGRGWYGTCFKKECPALRLGQDFAMRAYHLDRKFHRNHPSGRLPPRLVAGTNLTGLKFASEARIQSQGYYEANGNAITKRYHCGGTKVYKNATIIIRCPSRNKSTGGGNVTLGLPDDPI